MWIFAFATENRANTQEFVTVPSSVSVRSEYGNSALSQSGYTQRKQFRDNGCQITQLLITIARLDFSDWKLLKDRKIKRIWPRRWKLSHQDWFTTIYKLPGLKHWEHLFLNKSVKSPERPLFCSWIQRIHSSTSFSVLQILRPNDSWYPKWRGGSKK